MLRLLFITRDESNRLTVITDGIDSQLNVFVTENVIGDVDYFEGLGIIIRAGHTYNIGQFKQWAMDNNMKLIAYPEELNGKAQLLVDVVQEMRYILTSKDEKLLFKNTGDEIEAVVTSYKQLYVNGKPFGDQEPIEVSFKTSSPFNISESGMVTISENPTASIRKSNLIVTQKEGEKTITIPLEQAASTVSYTYNFKVEPTTLSFVNTGESKKVAVTSTKQTILNGKPSGIPTNVATDIELAGTGFSYSETSNGYNLIATENPRDEQRTATATITMEEGGKSGKITMTQNASVITYEYSLTSNPTTLSFAGGGETKTFSVTSTKQKKLNGKNSGNPITVPFTTAVSGAGFTKGSNDTTVVAGANNTETTRNGSVTVTQSEGSKNITINLTQAAGVVTYEYTLDADPDSLSFVVTGETKVFTVSSKKQKKINGQVSGPASAVNYTTTVTGTGFSKGDSEYSVIAANNTGAQRTGQAKVTASEGGKTVTVTLTQAGV